LTKQFVFKNIAILRAVVCTAASICAIALSACGAAPSSNTAHDNTLQVDGFKSYVTSFEQTAAQYGNPVQVTDLVIQFGQVDGVGENGGRGVCELSEGSTPVITISQAAWTSSSESEREELIFHELGHCVLHKTHVGGINSDGIPASIMNPYKIDGAIYSQYKSFYLTGLFAN
jgi:hypothetical protein